MNYLCCVCLAWSALASLFCLSKRRPSVSPEQTRADVQEIDRRFRVDSCLPRN